MLTEEDIDKIFKLVRPFVPPDKQADLRIELEKLANRDEEPPEVFSIDMLIKDIATLVGELVKKKTYEATGSRDIANISSRVAKATIHLIVGPKIREVVAYSQVRRVEHGDE